MEILAVYENYIKKYADERSRMGQKLKARQEQLKNS